jgi:glycogen debranching enzyme
LTKISVQNSSAVVIFTVGDTPEETASLSALVRLNYASLIAARKMRMENLLNESYLRTDNEQVTKALNWAKLSMDALLMNQLKKGIFAGLPWFDDYWGRDSYISLPGATLVTGRFAEAKDILRSFAQWQDTVPASPTYGRIPNLVTTNSIAYNTADGTPRFTMALNEYVRYSDDSAFAREMYPAVKTAIDGTIAHHMDEHCFLTHGDAETWMDAVGPDGPWSPRGNRANDLQELWYRQLQVGVGLAQVMGDYPSALQWGKIRDSLKENFNRDFVNPKDSLLYDHLLPDGTADTHLRPNQLFALDLLQDSDLRAKIFRNVTEKLVYLHGVVSLSQEDENFHPYHHYSPYYVQDAAYHNGIVWTWLSGRWIDEATRDHLPDLAFQVTDNTIHQMLDRGAVGTISELLDAAPRKGDPEPQLSGAFSQAWGLAEFIRSFYQSYLGVSVDASVPRLIIRPMLPKAIGKVRFVIPIGTNKIEAQYVTTSNGGEYTFSNADSLRDFQIRYEHAFDDGKMEIYETHLLPQSFLTLVVEGRSVKETGNDRARALQPAETQDGVSPSLFAGIKLAEPTILPSLKALKGPDYKVLTHEEIKTANSQAQVIYDVSDPEGDDNGGGSYVYPQTPYLKPGSLDITHCTISADANNMYFNLRFRNLSNPGWHPEYGFQLTYVAIVIDKNDGSGSKEIGMNSSYNTGKDFSIDNIIYIGGGVRIVDGAHKIIAEYLPGSGDETNPLGNVSNKSITFAVPQDIIGKPARDWKYLILVGAQDDHGGAGVGEFRTVEKEAKEWNGGGKKNPSDPNVYDVILPRASF